METRSINNEYAFVSRRRIIIIIVLCLFAIFKSGLRNLNYLPDSNDTPNYQTRYNEVARSSWGELLNVFSVFSSEYKERDKGYPIFMKLTQEFINDFTFFMFLTSTIFIASLGCLINKYVKSFLGVILSFLIYFALFTNIVDSFMRQAITLSIVMHAFKYILSRDWKRYFALVLIAFTIHSSAIIAVPFYFLPKFCKTRKCLLMLLIVSPISIYSIKIIMSIFLSGTVYSLYAEADTENPMNFILLVYFVSLFVYIHYNKIIKIEDSALLLSGALGAMFFLPIAAMGNTILRTSYYYVIFVIVLVPVLIDNVKMHKSLRLFVYYFSMCFFLYLLTK